MSLTIEMTGRETDGEIEDKAWKMFCYAHPVEAHEHDPERFWTVFHEWSPDVSRAEMEHIIAGIENSTRGAKE